MGGSVLDGRTIAHAVSAAGGKTYTYDCNGNMTVRNYGGGVVYNLAYDTENRLTGVSGAASAIFAYDGDGKRVKGTVSGATTVYIGDHFEWTSAGNTKYYYHGATRLAMRRSGYASGNGVFFLLGDHLGSTSLSTDSAGGNPTELRYKPWGETRFSSGTTQTTFRFTGQRQEAALGGADGLYYYGARWYDSYLNRWTSPDTIVPEKIQGVQAWDRYAYSNNNPIRYNDPSRHFVNVAVGALIGATVGVGLYALNIASSHQDFDVAQALTVAAVGAASGALISTGVGAVAGLQLFTGVGMAATAGGQLIANTITGSDFKTSNFVTASAYGFANGALGPVVGTTLGGAVALGGATSAASYAVTNVINGDPLTIEGALSSTAAGMISGGIGGAFPSLTNSHFVDNAPKYLIDQGIASFSKGFLGTTLANLGTNSPHFERKPCPVGAQ